MREVKKNFKVLITHWGSKFWTQSKYERQSFPFKLFLYFSFIHSEIKWLNREDEQNIEELKWGSQFVLFLVILTFSTTGSSQAELK